MTHDDRDVERVADAIRLSQARDDEGQFAALGDLLGFSGENAARTVCREAACAALSAMPPPELRIGAFVLRSAPNGIWIGRDGEGGEFATEHVERVIAQFYREQF